MFSESYGSKKGGTEGSMEDYLNGTWEEFENWIKGTIESDFSRRVRPLDSPLKREMVATSILDDIKRNNDVFPERNAFIQRASNGAGRNPKDTPPQPAT